MPPIRPWFIICNYVYDYYDNPLPDHEIETYMNAMNIENLRKRVSAAIYKNTATDSMEQASYYGYEQLGKKTLWQQMYLLSIKQIDCQYDKEAVTYYGNGNILTWLRNGSGATGMPIAMDLLRYVYGKDNFGRPVL